jgi:hypothetical protein
VEHVGHVAPRREVAIRLKPGSEQFIELVPSTEIFGQVAHYYPRGVGKGSFATHLPSGTSNISTSPRTNGCLSERSRMKLFSTNKIDEGALP